MALCEIHGIFSARSLDTQFLSFEVNNINLSPSLHVKIIEKDVFRALKTTRRIPIYI